MRTATEVKSLLQKTKIVPCSFQCGSLSSCLLLLLVGKILGLLLQLLYRVGVGRNVASVGLDLWKRRVCQQAVIHVQSTLTTYNALAVTTKLLVPVALAILLLLNLLVLDLLDPIAATLVV
jgi:hypothetical protein